MNNSTPPVQNNFDRRCFILPSKDQLKLVGQSCSEYHHDSLYMGTFSSMPVSCETCTHWTGKRCDIDVFDNVLTGLDQS